MPPLPLPLPLPSPLFVLTAFCSNEIDCVYADVDDLQFHYTQKVDFAQLKSEMQLVEKNDLALMKAENDRLMGEVDKLKQRLREEITRSQAGFRLDLNLEKGALFFLTLGLVLVFGFGLCVGDRGLI